MASKATEMSAPCSAQRRPAPPSALRRADSTRPLCVRVLDSTGSIRIRLFVLPKIRSVQCSRFAGGQKGALSSGRIDPTAFHSTQPRPAPPPRRASSRPDRPVVCPIFAFDKLHQHSDGVRDGRNSCPALDGSCASSHGGLALSGGQHAMHSRCQQRIQRGAPVPFSHWANSAVRRARSFHRDRENAFIYEESSLHRRYMFTKRLAALAFEDAIARIGMKRTV